MSKLSIMRKWLTIASMTIASGFLLIACIASIVFSGVSSCDDRGGHQDWPLSECVGAIPKSYDATCRHDLAYDYWSSQRVPDLDHYCD